MPTNEPFPGGPLYQCVVEWEVDGALDGATPAPGLAVDNNILTQQPLPPEQPFVIPVPGAAGLFDPDMFGGVRARADRYLQWIRVTPASFPVSDDFRLQVVDASNEVPSLGPIVVLDTIQSGAFDEPAFYIAEFDFVPHGHAILITGLDAPPPGSVHRIQMGIRAALTTKDDAELMATSCCLASDRPVMAQISEAIMAGIGGRVPVEVPVEEDELAAGVGLLYRTATIGFAEFPSGGDEVQINLGDVLPQSPQIVGWRTFVSDPPFDSADIEIAVGTVQETDLVIAAGTVNLQAAGESEANRYILPTNANGLVDTGQLVATLTNPGGAPTEGEITILVEFNRTFTPNVNP